MLTLKMFNFISYTFLSDSSFLYPWNVKWFIVYWHGFLYYIPIILWGIILFDDSLCIQMTKSFSYNFSVLEFTYQIWWMQPNQRVGKQRGNCWSGTLGSPQQRILLFHSNNNKHEIPVFSAGESPGLHINDGGCFSSLLPTLWSNDTVL